MQMFAVDRRGSVVVVTSVDQLDVHNALPAKEFFKDLVAREGSRIVVDLSSVGFLDSSGLAALVAALKAARSGGGDVRLCGLSDPVRSVFDATRLTRLFGVFENLDTAFDSFK